ncbi:MAG: hypothetical protein E7424_05700 [Ruminococcaceae bacterium]|nr:hypothetical protein [Oscillospiraceae bacterium]
MKKIIALILVLVMLFSLTACGSRPLNDERFVKNMQKGLEARWKISSNLPDTYKSNAEEKESYIQCVNAELNAIGDISEYSFENSELKELAEMYNSALQTQLEGIKYFGADDNKFNMLYGQDGYYNRARVICKLVDNYGLMVSNNYTDMLDDFVSTGRVRLELDEEITAMEGIITDAVVLECLGGTDYECFITNNTSYDLSEAQIDFNLFNDNGVLVETQTAYMNSWPAGSTNQCSIYVSKEFSKAEARISLFNDSLFDYLRTEYHPVEYVNDMIIEINLKNSLPCSVDYTSFKSLTTTCQVTSFDYEIGYWYDGKASVELSISGSKTYDEEGDSYSRGVEVGWKLYDDKEIVVDSGTFWSSDIKVGESFKDASTYVSDLAPGTYTLELLNVE